MNLTEEDASKGKHVVVAFGRMNPATSGHEKLLDTISAKAKELGASAHVHLSHTQDAKKNPVKHEDKVDFVKKSMPHHADMIRSEHHVKTFIDVLKHHSHPDHELHIMAGGDRVEEYKKLAEKYNGKDYHYKKIHVHSAGDRDPDAEGTEGMSASKMREHAKNNDYASFKSGLPSKTKEKDAKHIFTKVRTGMNLKESFEQLVLATILEMYQDAPEGKRDFKRAELAHELRHEKDTGPKFGAKKKATGMVYHANGEKTDKNGKKYTMVHSHAMGKLLANQTGGRHVIFEDIDGEASPETKKKRSAYEYVHNSLTEKAAELIQKLKVGGKTKVLINPEKSDI